ncbi:MAG: YegP family protein [Firmicutes bacterium]|nr:YegP family protein [Bacillota bacterium]
MPRNQLGTEYTHSVAESSVSQGQLVHSFFGTFYVFFSDLLDNRSDSNDLSHFVSQTCVTQNTQASVPSQQTSYSLGHLYYEGSQRSERIHLLHYATESSNPHHHDNYPCTSAFETNVYDVIQQGLNGTGSTSEDTQNVSSYQTGTDTDEGVEAQYCQSDYQQQRNYKETNTDIKFDSKAGNGQVIAMSEGHKAKASCLNGVESVKKNAPEAEITEAE